VYPINFKEFLAETGEEIALSFLNNFEGKKINFIYHRRLFDLLKKYFVTGGGAGSYLSIYCWLF